MLNFAVGENGLLEAFGKLCIAYEKRNSDLADKEIKNVKFIMETLDNQFVGNEMQKASEFLGRFLDEIKEDVKKRSNTVKDSYDEESCPGLSSLVYGNFVHEKEEVLICCSCKTETKSRTSDMSLWCETYTSASRTRNASLQQLLEESLAMETRTRRCEVCEGDVATVTGSLVKLPRVLIIFLKRFRYSLPGDSKSGKDNRRVTIPDTLCVSNLVSETVHLPDTTLTLRVVPEQTPDTTSDAATTPLVCPITPTKFKGLSQEQISMLGEDDQMEYMVHLSEKEAFKYDSSTLLGMADDEDEDLKAALDASMREQSKQVQMENSITPSRKRSYGELAEVDGIGGSGDGRSPSSRFGQERHDNMSCYANAVKGKSSTDVDTSIRRPISKEQEESDLKKALELSTLDAGFVDIQDDKMEDMENNNNMMDVEFLGPPEHSYQLQSVVSHYGSSANAGHYVADVFRYYCLD